MKLLINIKFTLKLCGPVTNYIDKRVMELFQIEILNN